MNAHATPVSSEALALAANNEAVLRALLAAPIQGAAAVAKAAGVDPKNIDRALSRMLREGLVETLNSVPKGWEITRTGRLALQAVDLANGRLAPPAAEAAADADNDTIMLLHHQVRPNPLNPRRIDLTRERDRRELDELKASIVSAGDVYNNLVVFPADVDGVHELSAGERRWRAVGELIAEGFWPRDRRLRAIQKPHTAGQTSFIALVENKQRADLPILEEARAWKTLIDDTPGLSARAAALKVGRDPRTVQQMLQVLREGTPKNIARCEDPDDDYTWEDLRRSVQQPTEQGDGDDGAQQVDLEEAVAEERAGARFRDPPADTTPLEILALVEIAARVKRKQHVSYGKARLFYEPDPAFVARFGINGSGCYFVSGLTDGTHQPHRHLLGLSSYGEQWLERAGHIRPEDPIADAVHYARLRAGFPRAQDGAEYETPWLRIDRAVVAAEQAARTGPPSASKPASAADRPERAEPPQRDLSSIEELALLELTFAGSAAHDDGIDHGAGWVRAGAYWKDTTFHELKTMALVDVTHQFTEDGPHVRITQSGLDRLDATLMGAVDLEAIDDEDLDAAREACGVTEWAGPGYVTPWLNRAPGEAVDPFGGELVTDHKGGVTAERDRRLDDEYAEAEAVLGEVATALDRGDDFDPLPLLTRAGVALQPSVGVQNAQPFKLTDAGMTISDSRGEPILELCGQGDVAADLLKARALLIVTTLNAALADWAPNDRQRRLTAEATSPAVPIRKSITPEIITCLEDGGRFISLTRHLQAAYGLTPDAYRERWSLPRDYPMVAPNEMHRRQQMMRDSDVEVPVVPYEDDDAGGEG